MKKNKFDLDEILENDPLGILDYKKRDSIKNNDQRLIESFQDINTFFEREKREPKKVSEVEERGLYSRLKGIRENPGKISLLKQYDKYDLLKKLEENIQVDSVNDIFDNDPLGILTEDKVDIFTLKNVPEVKQNRANADKVAVRERCEDFERYEPIFKKCQKELENGERKLIESIEAELKPGSFCVLDGILLYIVDIYEPVRGNSMKWNRRTEIVFENGTKSNMLLRSLGKRLKDSGKMVTWKDGDTELIKDESREDDIETGYIYILKSESMDDRISMMNNLFKIGFSSGEVGDRIKNAKKDPTYLMAPVTVVSSFKTLNMNPQKLEKILHQFFGNSRLDIKITDMNGDLYSPKEWFIAPLEVIENAIEMIVNGSIIYYKYNPELEEIEIKK